MAQVIANRRQSGAASEGVAGMAMAHPVRACPLQFVGERGMSGLEGIGGLEKEPAHDAPQPRTDNSGVAVFAEAGHQGRFAIPLFWRNRQLALHESA